MPASTYPYQPHTPFAETHIKVSELHTVYYMQTGNPNGKPVMFSHGGPGGGVGLSDTVFFNPDVYRVILFDQRGCGKSTPAGETKENTTWDLVGDMEKIRIELGIDKWMVFGGSWGSTLSLVYAETHPERTTSLIIRGIYLADDYETRHFYQDATKQYYPEEWERLANFVEPHLRHDLIYAYSQLLHGEDRKKAHEAAVVWTEYEYSCYKLVQDADYAERAGLDSNAYPKTVLEMHYFLNNCFFPDGFIISEPQISKIRHLPCHIVNGRYDVVCPPHVAHKLCKAYGENCNITWVPDAGHTAMEEGSMAALAKAADAFIKYQ